ncbi:MAG: ABC transporter permease [Acidobacteriota bacterium]
MTFSAAAPLAVTALLRNRLRSLLTTLGIVIGVAAVLMMQAMGEGATAYVGEAISGLGTNMLILVPGSARGMGPPTAGVPLFSTADLEAIRRQARSVDRVAPVNSRMFRTVAASRNRNVTVAGVTTEYFDIRQWGAIEGRLLTPEDTRRASPVCVVGQTVRDAMFEENPVGRELRVRDLACRVVGVLEAKGSAAFGMDQDDMVLMPFTTFSRRLIGNDRVATIMVSAVSTDRIDDAKREIVGVLHQRRHILPGEDDDFAVRDPREMQAVLQTVTGMLTTLLAGVAAISLVVGGIGIMNIMLVSVTERTREIGVRLAVGARAGDILAQFLVEAVILSALGGAIGVGAGLAGAYGVAHLIQVPFVVPRVAMPVAFAVSVLVGILFGVVPARKASRLSPLSALRFE